MCYRYYLQQKEQGTSIRPESIRKSRKFDFNNSGKVEDFNYAYESASKERLDSADSRSSFSSLSTIDRNPPSSVERTIGYNDNILNCTPAKLEYVEKLIPILEEIVSKIKDRRAIPTNSNQARILYIMRRLMQNHPIGKADMNVLYEDLPDSHFLFNSNIMAVIQLKALSPSKVVEPNELYEEIQPDRIIEQVIWFLK